LGWAKPIACDATAGSKLDTAAGSGPWTAEEDGTERRRSREIFRAERWIRSESFVYELRRGRRRPPDKGVMGWRST
jgi:hypothetical protein